MGALCELARPYKVARCSGSKNHKCLRLGQLVLLPGQPSCQLVISALRQLGFVLTVDLGMHFISRQQPRDCQEDLMLSNVGEQ